MTIDFHESDKRKNAVIKALANTAQFHPWYSSMISRETSRIEGWINAISSFITYISLPPPHAKATKKEEKERRP